MRDAEELRISLLGPGVRISDVVWEVVLLTDLDGTEGLRRPLAGASESTKQVKYSGNHSESC